MIGDDDLLVCAGMTDHRASTLLERLAGEQDDMMTILLLLLLQLLPPNCIASKKPINWMSFFLEHHGHTKPWSRSNYR